MEEVIRKKTAENLRARQAAVMSPHNHKARGVLLQRQIVNAKSNGSSLADSEHRNSLTSHSKKLTTDNLS